MHNPNNPNTSNDNSGNEPKEEEDIEAFMALLRERITQPSRQEINTISGREKLNVPVMDLFSSFRRAIKIEMTKLEIEGDNEKSDDLLSTEYQLLGEMIKRLEAGISSNGVTTIDLDDDLIVAVNKDDEQAHFSQTNDDMTTKSIYHQIRRLHYINFAKENKAYPDNDQMKQYIEGILSPYQEADEVIKAAKFYSPAQRNVQIDHERFLYAMCMSEFLKHAKNERLEKILQYYEEQANDLLYDLDYKDRMNCRKTYGEIPGIQGERGAYEEISELIAEEERINKQIKEKTNGKTRIPQRRLESRAEFIKEKIAEAAKKLARRR